LHVKLDISRYIVENSCFSAK